MPYLRGPEQRGDDADADSGWNQQGVVNAHRVGEEAQAGAKNEQRVNLRAQTQRPLGADAGYNLCNGVIQSCCCQGIPSQ